MTDKTITAPPKLSNARVRAVLRNALHRDLVCVTPRELGALAQEVVDSRAALALLLNRKPEGGR